jgi:hypothetical protein
MGRQRQHMVWQIPGNNMFGTVHGMGACLCIALGIELQQGPAGGGALPGMCLQNAHAIHTGQEAET